MINPTDSVMFLILAAAVMTFFFLGVKEDNDE